MEMVGASQFFESLFLIIRVELKDSFPNRNCNSAIMFLIIRVELKGEGGSYKKAYRNSS